MVKTSFFLFCLLFASCSQQPNQKFDADRITSEIIDMFEDYHAGIEDEGLTAEFRFLDSSGQFFWVPGGFNSALNYDSVKSILIRTDAGFDHFSFRFKDLNIIPLSSEIATYNGTVLGEMIDTAGRASRVNILESGTLIKRPDGWKLLSGQSVALNPE